MTRSVFASAILRDILITVCSGLALLFVEAPVALAQHGGGHVGGGHVGGGHVGGGIGGVHVAPPPIAHSPSAVPRFTPAPPIGHFGSGLGHGALLRYRGRP